MKLLSVGVIGGLILSGGICFATPNLGAQANYSDNLSIKPVRSEVDYPAPVTDPETDRPIRGSLHPALMASAALVIDQESGEVLFEKNANLTHPIASITKLMTAIVVLDAGQPLDQLLSVTNADAELARPTQSRLKVGAKLSRAELLRLMLMASENRAAAVIARAYPGGLTSFVKQMNETAVALGLVSTRFADPTGLHVSNVSTARDLTKLVRHAYRYDAIRAYSTTPEYAVPLGRARKVVFHNTNRLTRSEDWVIGLSKTGFISASGQCLVLQAAVKGRRLVMVILDSWGKGGRIEDAVRLRSWLEQKNQRWIVAGGVIL